MRILIAEDDPVSRKLLQTFLTKWGHDPVVTCRGAEAWEALQRPDAPEMAIVDWMMPEMEGPEIIRRQRAAEGDRQTPTYFILLTALDSKDDVVSGFDAGADDYVTKPFNKEELKARVQVGVRMVELRHKLADRVRELELALSANKTLRGLLPICAYCKKIRDDKNYWTEVESYIQEASDASFSHGVCPGCYDAKVKPQLDVIRKAHAGKAHAGKSAPGA
ncbi:MAG: response regulator transcription factor [Gemmatimonadetes bacterium]|nr:response regulator transcription factor [Gemmatimonadota bacterium]